VASISEIVLDCADADRLAEFWMAALGYTMRGRAANYRALSGDGPVLVLQQVDEPKTGKNRVHFDVEADDIRAEAKRLEALGATIHHDRRPVQEHETQWMVLADPEGNEFCVCQRGPVPPGDDGHAVG
jgi:predicted enzyme related to lactoylglutathione lyase